MTSPARSEPSRSTASLVGLGCLCLVLIAVLLGLGTWQVHRRAWKLDLIARVDARIHAAPKAPPGPAQWSAITAGDDEYRHVAIKGRYLNDRETLTQAVTDDGAGSWLMTPLRTPDGITVLINRGFVPFHRRDPTNPPVGRIEGEATVTGLLRLSEPGGGFLRRNDPGEDRWYSRDVAAIAAARGLQQVAPYFIDADGPPDSSRLPVGGLTVVSFPNSHLVYALTWYGLAAMLAAATVWIGREAWRTRRRRSSDRAPRHAGQPHEIT